jgi:N-carbamoyl-L-amino-acid hydrolase
MGLMRGSRRRFIARTTSAAIGFAAAPALYARQRRPASTPLVDAGALRARIEALSAFGRPAGGSFADGVSRVAYSDADVAGRAYVMGLMRAAGLAPRVDPAGNIFGRRAGSSPSAPPILFGSHIDSVPSGGNFDGDLGSLAALGVLEACQAAGTQTRHPLEMVVWSAEEGVAFGRGLAGSRIVAGDVTPKDLEQEWNGMTRADALRKIGGNPQRIDEATRRKGAYHGYLEMHIEQGGTLEQNRVAIGVVEGIVSIERYRVVVTGMANHAGTTRMADRHDALVAAAQVTLAVRAIVTARPGRQVGTVGQLDVEPNAPNVVPGVVRLTVEMRDLSSQTLEAMGRELRQRIAATASDTGTAIEVTPLGGNPPAVASPDVQTLIERAAGTMRLETTRLPSGASHDAQMASQLCPMGMIFVPSIAGISHSPKELTRWDDCANGANVLLHAVLEMDRV